LLPSGIVPLLRSGRQIWPLAPRQAQRPRWDQPAGLVHGTVAREEPEPDELHPRLRRELAAEEADAQLDGAIERRRRGRAPLVDARALRPVLGLRPEADPAAAAGAGGGREEVEMSLQIGAHLARVLVEAVADGVPGAIADPLGGRA